MHVRKRRNGEHELNPAEINSANLELQPSAKPHSDATYT